MRKPRLSIMPLFKVVLLELCLMILISCSMINYRIDFVANTETDVFRYTVEIANGIDTIQPLIFTSSSYQPTYEQGEIVGGTFADCVGMWGYDMVENLDDIPAIEATNGMTLILSDTINHSGVTVYDAHAEELFNWESWENLSSLPEGLYFIVLNIHNEIENAYANAQCLFVLCVDRST